MFHHEIQDLRKARADGQIKVKLNDILSNLLCPKNVTLVSAFYLHPIAIGTFNLSFLVFSNVRT
jgi:hypothetical protein